MSETKRSRYTRAPELPADETFRRRYEQVLAVLTGAQTVARAARVLDLPRNHFQTILHRGMAGLIDGLTPRPSGPPPKPAREAELEAENARLKAQLALMEERVSTIDRLIGVVGGVASGRMKVRGRKRPAKPSEPEEPRPATTALQEIRTMREQGAPAALCAAVLGAPPSTFRRWLAQACSPPRARPAPGPDPAAVAAAQALIRRTHGLPGAAAIARATGLTRREAKRIKQAELCRMEQERRAAAHRVRVAAPGVIRGFDAMHLSAAPARPVVLVAADAAIPFRTTLALSPRYDSPAVATTLDRDFTEHGPPLVCRLDRAACQCTDEVLSVLAAHRVLVLHGPPHYPRYYGQLERQNREHRAWLAGLDLAAADLDALLAQMRSALNGAWPRRSLAWCTAAARWAERPHLAVDRDELRGDVEDRAARLRAHGVSSPRDPDLCWRLAIEQALSARGLLEVHQGVTC